MDLKQLDYYDGKTIKKSKDGIFRAIMKDSKIASGTDRFAKMIDEQALYDNSLDLAIPLGGKAMTAGKVVEKAPVKEMTMDEWHNLVRWVGVDTANKMYDINSAKMMGKDYNPSKGKYKYPKASLAARVFSDIITDPKINLAIGSIGASKYEQDSK